MAREFIPPSDRYFPKAAERRSPCHLCTTTIEPGDAIVPRGFGSRWVHFHCAELEDELDAIFADLPRAPKPERFSRLRRVLRPKERA